MDWDARYVVSRSLTLEVSPAGKLVLAGSLSRVPQVMELDALPVLLGFAASATPREVFTRLQQDWEIEEAGFGEVVEAMSAQQFLTPLQGDGTVAESPALTDRGFGSARLHFTMLKDLIRVLSYRSAIERHAQGKTVVEIGCGTGVLSLFAARAGARRVIAIEESKIAEVATRMFAANACSDVIDLRVANSRNVELDEPADLIIHEILGVDPFEENLLPVLEDARRRLLRPGGRLLPYRLEVCCMGIEVEEAQGADAERMLAEAREFPGVYGLDFEPFLAAFEETVRRSVPGRNWIGGKARFEPKILSEELRFLDLDFRSDDLNLTRQTSTLPLRIVREGTLGGVVLFFRAHLDEHSQLTTSPLAPPTHWGWDIRTFSKRVPVSPGAEVSVKIEHGQQSGVQGLSVDLA
ncbi:MAG TPA: 50S ribosomal protein L11 methyltransferase [Thermoanaerobaculia bacterium]|nr:50S ribosomal protein L11 methyltransferase [Thermoanaerobaculia bacterium]